MKTLNALIAILSIAMISTTAASQDLQEGFDAYDAADYATALKEIRPLAEVGHSISQRVIGMHYMLRRSLTQLR